MLLQEILLGGHPHGATEQWQMLVGCILLNQTSRAQVDGVYPELFRYFPGPYSVEDLTDEELASLAIIIKPLGLQNVRALRLRQFSARWIDTIDIREHDIETMPLTDWELRQLPGIGDYAVDSYAIFVRGELDRQPQDKELKRYLAGVQSSR